MKSLLTPLSKMGNKVGKGWSTRSKSARKTLFGLVGVLAVAGVLFIGIQIGKKDMGSRKPAGEPAIEEAGKRKLNRKPAEKGEEPASGSAENSEKNEAAKGEATLPEEPLRPKGFFARLAGDVSSSMERMEKKLSELRRADQENERLRLENTNLRLKVESAKFECRSVDSAKATRAFEIKLDKETGTRMGRALASISYRHPSHLLPLQLYTLGMSYFNAREDEKAAEIFTFLTGMADDDQFRNARNYLMTGIAWYRLDNLAAANEYLDQALGATDITDSPSVQGQARLWKALVAQRMGRRPESQRWLREVLTLNPHSTEAKWVNQTREVVRALSSSH